MQPKKYYSITDVIALCLIVMLIAVGTSGYLILQEQLGSVMRNNLQHFEGDGLHGSSPLNDALTAIVAGKKKNQSTSDSKAPDGQKTETPVIILTQDSAPSATDLEQPHNEDLQQEIQNFQSAQSRSTFLQKLETENRKLFYLLVKEEIKNLGDLEKPGSGVSVLQYCLARSNLPEDIHLTMRQTLTRLESMSPSEQRNERLVLSSHVYVSLSKDPVELRGVYRDLFRDETDRSVLRSINEQFSFKFPGTEVPFVVPR